jgi:hypothetical protein
MQIRQAVGTTKTRQRALSASCMTAWLATRTTPRLSDRPLITVDVELAELTLNPEDVEHVPYPDPDHRTLSVVAEHYVLRLALEDSWRLRLEAISL